MALGILLFICENVLFIPNNTCLSIDPSATIRAGVINWQTAVGKEYFGNPVVELLNV